MGACSGTSPSFSVNTSMKSTMLFKKVSIPTRKKLQQSCTQGLEGKCWTMWRNTNKVSHLQMTNYFSTRLWLQYCYLKHWRHGKSDSGNIYHNLKTSTRNWLIEKGEGLWVKYPEYKICWRKFLVKWENIKRRNRKVIIIAYCILIFTYYFFV